MKELGLVAKKGEDIEGTAKPETIQGYISTLKNEMIDVETYLTQEPSNPYIDWEKAEYVMNSMLDYQEIIEQVYPRYQEELAKSNAVDFDDLILKTIHLFVRYEKVLEKYQHKFHYIMVDEYQDTNHAQYILISLLAQKHRNLAVVGDDFQSIYAFRGSDIRNILNFDDDYEEAKIIKLEQNYRSTQRIIQAANEVIEKNKNQKKKVLFTENEIGEKIKLHQSYTAHDEADHVARNISALRRKGISLNDMAILYRSNYQSGILETALNRSGIANRVVGDINYWNRMEVLDAVAYLQLICNSNSTADFERIINKPKRGIGESSVAKIMANFKGEDFLTYLTNVKETKIPKKAHESLQTFLSFLAEMMALKEEQTASKVIKAVIEKSNYKTFFAKEDRMKRRSREENLNQLAFMASDLENKLGRNLPLEEFMEEVVLRNMQDQDEDENTEKVSLMSIHASKGSEYPAVFIVGMNEGVFPAPYAETEADKEEERRICYVALTRAKRYLYLSYNQKRLTNKYDEFGRPKTEPAAPSRFLTEFTHDIVDYSANEFYY